MLKSGWLFGEGNLRQLQTPLQLCAELTAQPIRVPRHPTPPTPTKQPHAKSNLRRSKKKPHQPNGIQPNSLLPMRLRLLSHPAIASTS